MGEAAAKEGQPEPEGARRDEPALCVDRQGHCAHRQVQQVHIVHQLDSGLRLFEPCQELRGIIISETK